MPTTLAMGKAMGMKRLPAPAVREVGRCCSGRFRLGTKRSVSLWNPICRVGRNGARRRVPDRATTVAAAARADVAGRSERGARVRRKPGFRVTETLFYGVLRGEYVQYSSCSVPRFIEDAGRRKLPRSQWLCR